MRPPTVDDLLSIPEATWRSAVAHVRRALHALDDVHVTPAVARLRALPANRLMQGRARRDLADVIALGGPIWLDLHGRLERAGLVDELDWLLEGRPAGNEPAPDGAATADASALEALRAELDQARSRTRRLKKERDEARRQVDGARARQVAAEDEAQALGAQVEELRARLAGLEDAAAQAARDQERAVARERRRHEATIAGLREELTALRRADQDRLRAEQDRERAQQVAAEAQRARDAEQREAERARRAGARDRAAPGRPSELPPGVAPGTTAHAKALLAPGRRVIVDGYNVAKTVRPDLGEEEAQRAWLERSLAELAARTDVRPEVYWDGDKREGSSARHGPVAVTFSPRDIEADDDIEFAVAAAELDEPLVVVTDDRALRERLRPYGVDLLRTQPFSWALRG